MHSPGRWQPSTPWQRVWPVAAAVIAAHAVFLHGWQLANGGIHPPVPTVSTMVVRLLTPSPAPSEAAPAAPTMPTAVAAPESTDRRAEAQRPATARPSQVAAASAHPAPAASAAVPSRKQPESEYFAGSRLDPGPKLLDDVEPVYPPEAGMTEGSVVLRLLIGTTGAVDQVTVVSAAPKGLFERAAIAAFSAARFSPGKVLGVPVKSQVTIEVQFTPVDRGANVSAPTY